MYELGKKLGPEYAALIDGLEDIDPVSEVGQEISSTLDALDIFVLGVKAPSGLLKSTSAMSAHGPKADMPLALTNVRFWGNSGHLKPLT